MIRKWIKIKELFLIAKNFLQRCGSTDNNYYFKNNYKNKNREKITPLCWPK